TFTEQFEKAESVNLRHRYISYDQRRLESFQASQCLLAVRSDADNSIVQHLQSSFEHLEIVKFIVNGKNHLLGKMCSKISHAAYLVICSAIYLTDSCIGN